MQEIFRFIGTYQVIFYLLLLLAGISSLRWLLKAWKEWRESYFALEREITMRRLAQAVIAVTLVLILLCGVFSIAIFIVPSLPAGILSATPTLDLLSTPSSGATLAPDQLAATTVAPVAGSQGCIPGQLEITSPKPGDEISGTVTLVGTVDLPNFGWYKYEVTLRGTENWISISAQSTAKKNKDLGVLNTTMFTPGDYLLRVVVFDNDTQVIGTCIITIRIKGQ